MTTRLSKRQSLATTVLFRTVLTRTIMLQPTYEKSASKHAMLDFVSFQVQRDSPFTSFINAGGKNEALALLVVMNN